MALAEIVFVYTPETVAVTLTRIVHTEPAGIVAFVNVNAESPLVPLTDAELPQFDRDGDTGFARMTFAGRLSVSDAWVIAVPRSVLRTRIVS